MNANTAAALTGLGLELLRGGRYGEAAAQLQKAAALAPDQPQLWLYLGMAQGRLGLPAEALHSYDRALALKADFVEAWCNRGNTLIVLDRRQAALESFDAAIAARADYALAHFNRGNLLRELGRPAEAEAGYRQALALQADFAEALGNLGSLLREQGRPAEALACFESLVALRPGVAAGHFNRGNALLALQRPAEALDSFRRALALAPGLDEAELGCGQALRMLRRHAEALCCYDRELARTPGHAEALAGRGAALLALGRDAEALDSLQRALHLRPEHADAWCNLGIGLQALHRHDEAMHSFDRALALDPGHAGALNNRGNSLRQWQRLPEALADYEQALARQPELADAWCNRAAVLLELGQTDAALASCQRALDLQPGLAAAWLTRAAALERQGRFDAALAAYRQALALDADTAFAAGQALFAALMVCDWDGLAAAADRLRQRILAGRQAANPFNVLALCDEPAVQRQAAATWVAATCPEQTALPAPAAYPQHPRIRIGYFSGDFHSHPVAVQCARLLEVHDRARFEIVGFGFGGHQDAMSARLQAGCDRFVDLRGLSDPAAAQLARELEIDIAVDLNGHTTGSRNGIFALRAAPVQVNFLGYPGTLGAGYMDYLIADAVVVPPGGEHDYHEKVVRLAGSYLPIDDTRPVAASGGRRDYELPDGFIFCCFNNSWKLNPPIFDCWLRILTAVADSVLWLSATQPEVAGRLRAAAAQAGVDAGRLIFAERVADPAEHLGRLALADLFLDTLPYNAHATAGDALWAGLPVLTCQGRGFAGRVATSLLHALELPELVTASMPEYQALAIALAQDPQRLAGLRARLAAARRTAPLFDSEGYARRLEAAYRTMQQRALAGLAPAALDMPA